MHLETSHCSRPKSVLSLQALRSRIATCWGWCYECECNRQAGHIAIDRIRSPSSGMRGLYILTHLVCSIKNHHHVDRQVDLEPRGWLPHDLGSPLTAQKRHCQTFESKLLSIIDKRRDSRCGRKRGGKCTKRHKEKGGGGGA
jgi:hypothetical protein